ncbi:MAG TPA: radical SAM protein [Ohtaekwangia sp.]|uniref:SPL family radical SAM protein n=1 Tax=Ohtaekwangia sp. TaxID=2066019 RepID=UPI002F937955
MIREITVKSVLNKKKKRDSWFLDDYTLNPYEGCSFNCQYCYVRGSKYGENMEESLAVKINAQEVLDRQLAFRVKKDQRGIIALASATDPYIRIEEKLRMTEGFLKLILKHRFPVLIITKSDLVVRDLALLKEIDQAAIHAPDIGNTLTRGAIVSFSFSTLDESIAATLEPGAPSPQKRLEAMQQCREAGLMTGVNCIPTLPFLSDSDEHLERMIIAAKAHGAEYILFGGLTLFGNEPSDSKTLYYKFLQRYSPAYIPEYKDLYGSFYSPLPHYLRNLETRAAQLCLHHGIRNRLV